MEKSLAIKGSNWQLIKPGSNIKPSGLPSQLVMRLIDRAWGPKKRDAFGAKQLRQANGSCEFLGNSNSGTAIYPSSNRSYWNHAGQ